MYYTKLYASDWLIQSKEKIKIFASCAILILFFSSLSFSLSAQKKGDLIKLNQVGYYVNSTKIAVITGKMQADYFYVVSADAKDTLYEGFLSGEKESAYSSTITRFADFTSFNKEGNYILRVPNIKQSFPFEIKNDVYSDLGKAILKGFYYQRSSISLDEKYAGKWSRAALASDDVVFIHPSAVSNYRTAGTIISSPGGWYDAGDYNKYVVNSSITMSTLISSYEDFSSYLDSLKTNIPESDDKIPDILNEVLYNLRWMLTMQDPFDGGVYHKCTNAEFDKVTKTGNPQSYKYVVQKSTAATLDFAAVMAQAGRVFRKLKTQLPGLADSCLKASANAWFWALKHPNLSYDQEQLDKTYKPAVTTYAYADRELEDEWMWAATEMFVTSKNKMYFEVIEQSIDDSVSLPSWSSVRMLGYYSMLRYQDNLPKYAADMIALMRKRLLKIADNYLDHVSSNAFATVMGQSKDDFIWGSNSVAANQGILLINAYLATGNPKYIQGSMTNLDYLLGRNATGFCFVTGCFGTKSPMHPYHKPSIADNIDEPVPGLLVGGPNPGKEDKCHYPITGTETAYVDNDCAYASNAIDINWNAAMAYLVNAIQAMQYQLGFSKEIDSSTTLK